MGTGNTTAMFHAGRLYALKEDDLPHRIDPVTLATLGRDDFDGAIRAQTFTAHPKVDPVTDELLAFAYQARGDATRDIVFYAFGPDRKLLNEIWFEMPFAANVHDFAITDEWIVFSFYPLITDLEVLKAGGPYYQWHADEEDPCRVGASLRLGARHPLVQGARHERRSHDERAPRRLEGAFSTCACMRATVFRSSPRRRARSPHRCRLS